MNFETFKRELESLGKELTEVSMGSFNGFSHKIVTGAHTFHNFDLFVEGLGFIHLDARDSFDPALMEKLLESFEENRIKKYKQDVLRVTKTLNLEKFDCYGFAPPKLAQVYKSQSDVLSKNGYYLFPMYGIEFLDNYTEEQFLTQRHRRDKWCVCTLDWNRVIEKR